MAASTSRGGTLRNDSIRPAKGEEIPSLAAGVALRDRLDWRVAGNQIAERGTGLGHGQASSQQPAIVASSTASAWPSAGRRSFEVAGLGAKRNRTFSHITLA